MAKGILMQAEPYKDSFKLTIPSEYNRNVVKDLVTNKKVTLFELTPRIRASKNQRGFLEGAVIPLYAKWQYQIDPRDTAKRKTARDLFKLDFNFEIVKSKTGEPQKVPLSLRKKQAEVLDRYTSWANENGAPIPSEKLYKMWRDEYSMDLLFQDYYDWLDKLELEEDSMPSQEHIDQMIKKLNK